MRRILLSLAALLSGALASSQDIWTLTGYDFNQSSFSIQPYVSNGYIGQRLPVAGFGYSEIQPLGPQNGTNGWPLFDHRFTAALVAGFYDQQDNTTGTNFAQTGGQQPISTIPTWSSLYLTVNGTTLQPDVSPDHIANFSQSMSIQDGVVQTSYQWTPPQSNAPVSVRYTLFAHRTRPNLGVVRLDVEGLDSGAETTLTDVLDGQGSYRTQARGSGVMSDSNSTLHNAIYSTVSPNGVDNVTCVEVSSLNFVHGQGNSTTFEEGCFAPSSNSSTASQCYAVTPQKGLLSVTKYVGIASTDAFPGQERETAVVAVSSAVQSGFSALMKEHRSAWGEIWDSADIVIPGEKQKALQLAVRASLFHLLSNVRKGSEPTGLGDTSIAPAGLTSDSYAGQIFWDADTWMSYPLIALFPEYAENILNHRYRYLEQAKENAEQYNLTGALYPWTNGRYGNCTGVGPCYDYEYHLNNDIALSQIDYFYTTQNKTWLQSKGYPVISAVADMWPSLVDFNKTLDDYTVNNATDPDEYANFQDSPAFTNAGVTVVLDDAQTLGQDWLGLDVPQNWSKLADNMVLLQAPSGIVLEYEGFNGTIEVKQADVVLLTWPLEYNLPRETALQNFAYYAGATSANGPGMTYSIFSIGLEQLSQTGCAGYTYMLASSQPYSRSPFYQFSEQTNDVYNDNGGTNPAFTFLTGHGGFLQSFTHGFTGFRPRLHAFYLDPALPPQLPEVVVKGMHWKDSLFDVNMTLSETIITRTHGEEAKAWVEIGGQRNSKAGNYSLAVGESLQVPTFVNNGLLLDGNVAQCQSIFNSTDLDFKADGNDDVVAGQYTLAAIDGNNATTWQPQTNGSASLIVQLEQAKALSHLHLNFGGRPARSVALSVGSDPSNLRSVVPQTEVLISAPAGSFDAAEVVVRTGNTTDVDFEPTEEVQFVQLSISGCFEPDGVGATVAEMAVF